MTSGWPGNVRRSIRVWACSWQQPWGCASERFCCCAGSFRRFQISKEYPQILFFGNIGHPGSVTVVCYLFQTKQLTRKDKLAREVQLDCVQNTLEPPEATNR